MMKRTDLLLVRVQLRGRGHDDALLFLDEGPPVGLLRAARHVSGKLSLQQP